MSTTNCSCFPIVQKPKKMPLKIKVGGMQRSNKIPQMKKVAPPVVPEMANRNSAGNYVTMDSRITTYDENFSPQPSPLRAPHTPTRENFEHGYFTANGVCPPSSSPVCNYQQFTFSATQQHYNTVLAASPRSTSTNNSLPGSPLQLEAISNYSQGHHHFFDKYVHLCAPVASNGNLDDQGIDVQTPSQESPGSSGSSASGVATSTSGCRNSTTSLDSGRASASNYDAKSGQSSFAPSSSSSSSSSSGSSSASSSQHRLSGQSYESNTSLRHSYHSSSSSLGSMDRLDERSPHPSTGSYNVGKLLADGVPDSEVLRYWLGDLHFEDYYQLFIQAGYDLPTISRMTPEDLTAIGITKPAHRKKLKAEIVKMNISDGLPEYVPGSLDEWLRLLRIEEYAECLAQQGYNSVEDVLGIAWEDLEEIGIRKLGHQKKVMLALKRVRDIQSGVRRFSSAENWTSVEVNVALPSHRTLHHQHSLSQGHAGYPSPAYHGPEVMTIGGGTMSRPHAASPLANTTPASEELSSVPQFSTFHHPTMPHQHRQQTLNAHPGGGGYSAHFGTTGGSPMHLMYNPDILTVMQGRHPSGARSLESLDHEADNSAVVPVRHHVTFQAPPVSSPYESHRRRSSFDDGDVTPTNEMVGTGVGVGVAVGNGGLYLLQDGVGGTLPRPKVSVKPRPVAKIVAKTRRLSSDRDDDQDQNDLVKDQKDFKGCKVECTAVVHGPSGPGSGSMSLPGSPRNSLLRASASKRTPPPPPPKRTNSVRLNHNPHQQQEKEKMSNEQLFATCVKTLASKFGMTRQSGTDKRPGAKDATVTSTSGNVEATEATTGAHFPLQQLELDADQGGDTLSQPDSDSPSQNSVPDFGEFADQADRSPPSPAPGSPVRCLSDTRPSTSCSSPSPSNSPSPSPSMSLPQPKRNESTSSLNSNVSTSSTESNSLPFANENAGTIKQRAIKPHPPLPGIPSCSEREGPMSPRTTLATLSSSQASKRQCASRTPTQAADNNLRQNRPHDTGDVLNDIDNMLANLTDELDAMLTSELENQP